MSKPNLSIIIPTYDMHGIGPDRLRIGLSSIASQSLHPSSVIVIDSSVDDGVKKVCTLFEGDLTVKYVYRPRLGYGEKLNLGLKLAASDVVKLLNQDDYFARNDAVAELSHRFEDPRVAWSADPTIHTYNDTDLIRPFFPTVGKHLHRRNTLSAPSVIALRTGLGVFFDPRFHSRIDIDFYARMVKAFGHPLIGTRVSTIQFLGSHQVSRQLRKWHRMSDRVLTLQKRLSLQY